MFTGPNRTTVISKLTLLTFQLNTLQSYGFWTTKIHNPTRPASRILLPASRFSPTTNTFPSSTSTTTAPSGLRHLLTPARLPRIPTCSSFHSLTDTRYPKRRPIDKAHHKRASLKPPGPYAWVKCAPDEPIPANQPNVGSLKRRNEKKRIKHRRAFIMSEKRKRKAQLQEAKKKKMMKRVERKMAAVARERAWAERLVELQRIEAEKKKAVASA